MGKSRRREGTNSNSQETGIVLQECPLSSLVPLLEWNSMGTKKEIVEDSTQHVNPDQPVVFMTAETAALLCLSNGAAIVISTGNTSQRIPACSRILTSKERGFDLRQKQMMDRIKLVRAKRCAEHLKGITYPLEKTVDSQHKEVLSSEDAVSPKELNQGSKSEDKALNEFLCPKCRDRSNEIVNAVLGVSSRLYNELYSNQISCPKNLPDDDGIILFASITPIVASSILASQRIVLKIQDVTELKGMGQENHYRSQQWKTFDRLQTAPSQLILRSSFGGTFAAVSNHIQLTILGVSIEFEITAMELAPDSSGQCSTYPENDECTGCGFKYPPVFRILPTVDVCISPPVLVPVDSHVPIIDHTKIPDAKEEQLGMARVGGCKAIIRELRDMFIAPLMCPSLFRSLGISPPKGVLLYGPPGTGKTHLARALAEELEVRWGTLREEFRNLAGGDFPPPPAVEHFSGADITTGGGDAAVDNLFRRCRLRQQQTGCGTLIFIDEIDSICPNRESTGDAERAVVSAFLTNLDGLTSDSRIVLLAATNRPNAIDPALRRAGRLDREIEVDVPSGDDRVAILSKILDGIHHTLTLEEIHSMAWDCHVFVAADLKCLCTLAALKAIDEFSSLSQSGEVVSGAEPSKNKSPLPCLSLHHLLEALKTVKPSAMKEVAVEVPCVRWSDIGGYTSVKEKLQECVEWPIKYREIFSQLEATPPKGVLLYGPPGCSKTLLAKAVATESKMNFIAVKGPELFSKWVGESERAVREVFRKARQNSPCVIFFDEIDSLGGDRQAAGGGSGVESRVLSQMLNEMDGIGGLKQVVVIGATNRPDLLDAALLRPGRLDRLVYVPLPDAASRADILRVHLKLRSGDKRRKQSKAVAEAVTAIKRTDDDDQDEDFWKGPIAENCIGALTGMTQGYSGAEIAMICRESAMLALRERIEFMENNSSHTNKQLSSENTMCDKAPVVIRWDHIKKSLGTIRPRISPSLIAFYEKYNDTK